MWRTFYSFLLKQVVERAGVTEGSMLLVLLVIVVFYINYLNNVKREDQVRIEKFLEDYRALKPTRFSYFEIKRIANGFKYKFGEAAHGVVFKGSLIWSLVYARVW